MEAFRTFTPPTPSGSGRPLLTIAFLQESVDVSDPDLSINDHVRIDMVASYPVSDTTWRVKITNENSFPVELTLWATCAVTN